MTEQDGAIPAQGDSKKLYLYGFIVVGAIALCLINTFKDNSSSFDPADDAKRVCQEEFVPDYLKAPSTAEFSAVTVSSDGSRYTVRGKVDAQNSFGAQIRSDFSCVVHESGKNWVLDSANVY